MRIKHWTQIAGGGRNGFIDNRPYIETVSALEKYVTLDDSERSVIAEAADRFPMRITPYYLSLIDPNDPNDPIRRMCIPFAAELDASGSYDTSGENDNTVRDGIQHKYKQTALVLSTNVCAAYCRHCFRKRMVGASETELNKQVSQTVEYVRAHPEITNVLLSGGDALMNPNRIIRRYLEELCEIKTLDLIRLGSRVPVVLPKRIYDDNELFDIFVRCTIKKTVYVVTQFNHPREVTKDAALAVKTLREAGVHLRNQTVLLRGVNDDVPDIPLYNLPASDLRYANSVLHIHIHSCRSGSLETLCGIHPSTDHSSKCLHHTIQNNDYKKLHPGSEYTDYACHTSKLPP